MVVGKDDEQLVEMLRQTANDYKFLAEKVVIVSTAERAFTSAVIPDAPGDLESGRYLTAIENSIRAGTIPGDGIFALDLAPRVCRGETPCPDVSESAERYRPTDGIHYEGNQVYSLARWILEESMRIGSSE